MTGSAGVWSAAQPVTLSLGNIGGCYPPYAAEEVNTLPFPARRIATPSDREKLWRERKQPNYWPKTADVLGVVLDN